MITGVRLQNFRSYSDDSFEFEPGVNIIVGPNASGKTSLIEAILVASVGGSYRGRDQEMIMHGKPWARIDMFGDDVERVIKLQFTEDKVKKTIELDSKKVTRMPIAQTIPFVLFEPNHLLLFHGGPELRREFLDNLLMQLKPEYGTALRQYKRALLQRNSLLKSGRATKDSLFVWNLRLSDLGGFIAAARQDIIRAMQNSLPDIYQGLTGTQMEIAITYESGCNTDNYASSLLQKLEQSMHRDIERGFTVYGPHRDDMGVYLYEHPIKESASRGEIRTVVLACKVFEQAQIRKITQKIPIFLLDDVFSELDGSRRKALASYLKTSQVFITTTDADVVIKHFSKSCNVIALSR